MVKRMNKITSLLVAAAAIASIVPATSVEAAVRLGNKEGTIKQGIAFDDGKYSYYGYKTDTDLTGVYSNNGTDAKEAFNQDLEDYRLNTLSKFGTKYAYAYEQSNDDEYLIDLSTGKIVDDETKEEKEDLAKANLVAKIKKAERYNSGVVSSFSQILQGQFGEVWYKYSADGDKVTSTTTTVEATKTAVGYKLPQQAVVAKAINDREIAKLQGVTSTVPTYTIGGIEYKYDDGLAASANTFHNYADIVTLITTRVNSINLSSVDYDKVDSTTTTAGGTTVSTTPAVLFAGSAVQQGDYIVKEAAVAGSLETIGGVTNAEIGAIKDIANAAKAELVYGVAQGGNTVDTAEKLYGFTNEAGTYIDASYTANMKIYSATKGRAVTVAQFGEEVKDAGLKVDLVSIDAIAQDKDYIYTITKVKVTGAGSVAEDQTFIQKISKAQGTKTDDGAYTPKEVKSYQLNNGIYDNDDASDALALLNGTNTDYQYLLGITVKGGNTVYVTRANKDEVKVYKVELDDSVKSDVVANGATLKTDVDTALALSTDDADEDVTSFDVSNSADDEGLQGITAIKVSNEANADEVKLNGETLYKHPSVSIDVNGNTWTLKKGKITKFDGINKNADIYTVDGVMNAIDVYDDENLIAWDVEGDVYTTVTEGKAQTGTEAGNGNNTTPETPVETKKGWVKTEAGWTFYKADGSQTKGQWIQEGGVWYMIKADGIMATGWYKDNGTWYYLNGSGAMKTGWLNDNGTWYFLQGSGAMKTGWLNDNGTWYYLNGSGAMKTGWLNDNGTWYYLNGSGAMLSNTTVGGYRLGASGAWVK